MPNHVTNTLRIEGKDSVEVLEEILNKERQLDFNLVKPMPPKMKEGSGWYDWSIKNWGTKWNAYESYEESGFIRFCTAWSMPDAYYISLSKKYPKNTFHVTWYDEDAGFNLGTGCFLNGKFKADNVPQGGSKQAYELLFELEPSYRDDLILKDGEYIWKED